MSRGRKAKANSTVFSWEQIANKNVGKYLQYIIVELGKLDSPSTETGAALLKKIKQGKAKSKKEKELSPIKAEEIPYQIAKNWAWCRLGEIIEFTDNLNIETKFSKDTLINYVDIEAIDNKKYEIRESKLKPVSELSSRARRVLKKGYIVYSLVRPYLNNIAIIEDEKPNYIGSTGFAVFNGILVDNRFLKLFLLSEYIRELYLSMFSGFNSPSITQEQFSSTLIPLPPLSEQAQIINFLNDFENDNLKEEGFYFNPEVEQKVIALHESQLKGAEIANELAHQRTLVKNLRQQLLQDAVQGKLVKNGVYTEGGPSAHDLLKQIKKEKAQLIRDKKLKKEKELPPIKVGEIPFEIPENWAWCRLGEICESRLGKMLDGIKNKGDFYPYLRNLNVRWFDFNLEDVLKMKFEKNELEEYSVKKGDLLICEGGYPGRAAIWESEDESYKFQKALHRVRFYGKISSWFYLYYLDFICSSGKISEYFTGSGIQHFTGKSLKQLSIPLPPLAEQHQIVSKIDSLMQVCAALDASIESSARTNEALLQQVLREALGQS